MSKLALICLVFNLWDKTCFFFFNLCWLGEKKDDGIWEKEKGKENVIFWLE